MTERVARRFRTRCGAVLVAGAAAVTAPACAISHQQELEMGRQYSAQLDRELPLVNDAALVGYLNRLGGELARGAGRRDVTYRFRLVNSSVVNAFAVPGGYIYVNRGVVERADDMAELAGVLAHEIGHVEHRHGIEQLQRAQRTNVGLTLAYVLLGRQPGGLERAAIGVGGTAYLAGHSREAENEADATAVRLLVRAGIDPNGLPAFFRRLMQQQAGSPSGLQQWFSTHPTTEDRIAATQRRIAQVPPEQLRGLRRDSREFREFRAAVRRLPAPPAAR
jgi:predicted Zn-dependent protease